MKSLLMLIHSHKESTLESWGNGQSFRSFNVIYKATLFLCFLSIQCFGLGKWFCYSNLKFRISSILFWQVVLIANSPPERAEETSPVIELHKLNQVTFGILTLIYVFIYLFIYFCFSGLHLRHIEVPRLGVKSELQLQAYTTATATPDLSHVCDLYHSSQQHWIPNPLSEVKDGTRVLMDISRVP